MPIFSYKGYDSQSGANRKGKIDADSERAAKQLLKQRHKIIVAEIKEETASSKKSGGTSSLFAPKVSLAELSVMVRQFATLQEAHVPLDECLKALVSQVENPVLRNTLARVKDSVSEGKSLADSSAGYPRVFNKLYVNMVRAGESSGNLGTVLVRLADFIEYQVEVRGKVVGALTYPAIMITVMVLIISFLLVAVIPKLAKVFVSLKVSLPWYTKALLDFSAFMQNYWYIMIAAVLGGVFMFKSWLATENGRKRFDQLSLQVPLVGPIMLMLSVSRFTKTLSTLLGSGVPIIQALDITKNVVTNSEINQVLEQAKIEVQEGNSLAACISRSGKFPGLVTHMIATGERSGQLETMLAHVANAYDAEVERKIAKMIAFIEPMMMIFLALLGGVVVFAVMMPMFDVMKQVR